MQADNRFCRWHVALAAASRLRFLTFVARFYSRLMKGRWGCYTGDIATLYTIHLKTVCVYWSSNQGIQTIYVYRNRPAFRWDECLACRSVQFEAAQRFAHAVVLSCRAKTHHACLVTNNIPFARPQPNNIRVSGALPMLLPPLTKPKSKAKFNLFDSIFFNKNTHKPYPYQHL